MKNNYLKIIHSFAKKLHEATDTQVVVLPSEVKSEKFHFELSLLPHPIFVGNGRTRIRLKATLFAEIPPSNEAINDCLERSVKIGWYFDEAQPFPIDVEKDFYGTCFATALNEDEDAFLDFLDQRSYSYTENWILELEFSQDKIEVLGN